MIAALKPVQERMDQFIDDSNGRDKEAEARTGQRMSRRLTWRDVEVLNRLRAFPNFLDDQADLLRQRPGYDFRKDFIHEITRHTLRHLTYSNTSLVVHITRDLVPECTDHGVYIRLFMTDCMEQLFSKYRSNISQALTIRRMAEYQPMISLRQLHHLRDFYLNGWRIQYRSDMDANMTKKITSASENYRHRGSLLNYDGTGKNPNCATWERDNNGDDNDQLFLSKGRGKARGSVGQSGTMSRLATNFG